MDVDDAGVASVAVAPEGFIKDLMQLEFDAGLLDLVASPRVGGCCRAINRYTWW